MKLGLGINELKPGSGNRHSPGGAQAAGVVRGCLIVSGAIVLALIGGCLYFNSRRPHFSGTSPLALEVHVPDIASTNVYQMTITNRSACEAIVRDFSQARPVFGSSIAVGTLTFRYDSGKTDVVWILPGMPTGYYTISQGKGKGTFKMPSDTFYQLLKDGGVDVSKIPKD